MITRRHAILKAGAAALAASCASEEQHSGLQPTPPEIEGPFFPVNTASERDADLTRVAGRPSRALGDVIEVRVRVLNRDGAPVPGAALELWQANAAGRYNHPRDTTSAPLDENFQGYALLRTDGAGRIRVTTVKPGPYPAPQGQRTPHLHWKVRAGAKTLTTQMYFPGEALNEVDFLMLGMPDARPLVARAGAADEAGALGFDWDLVLSV